MNNAYYWLFYIFWSSLIIVVSSAHITALKEKVSGLSNSSIDLRWHIVHRSNQRIAVLNLYVLPDIKNSVLSALMPALQPRGAALFENRLSAKLVNGTYTAVLRNVGQNDRCFFQLQAVFMNPLESQTATMQISVVEKLSSPMPPSTTKRTEETSTKPVMTQTKVVPSLGTTIGTKDFNTCRCDNKGGIIIGVIVVAVVMQILILAICLPFMKRRVVSLMTGLVHNADERTVTKNVTATVGSTFDVRWYIRWERYIFYVSTNMEKPEQRFILSSGSAGFSRKYPKHEELFGNRLITDFMYLRSGFRIQLKDVRYNETLSFHLKTVFDINTSVTTTYNMIVVGSPVFCVHHLKSHYEVTENDVLKFTHNICGYPQPTLKWKIGEDAMFESSFNSTLINDDTKQYNYVSKTQPIKRKYCGRNITFKATNGEGNAEKSYKLDVTFSPSPVSIGPFYAYNQSCIQFVWYVEDTGKCAVTHHLQVDYKGHIYNTLNTYLTICNVKESFNVSIWSSYKGKVGKKSTVAMAKIFQTSRKVLLRHDAKIRDSMNTILITVSISLAVAIMLVIVVFLILKCKGVIACETKQIRKQRTVKTKATEHGNAVDTEQSIYEVPNTKEKDADAILPEATRSKMNELMSSTYTDLKLQATTSGEYADLKITDYSRECTVIKTKNAKNYIYYNSDP